MTESPYFWMFLHVAGFSVWSSLWPRQFLKRFFEPKIGYKAYRLFYNAGTIFLFGASLLHLFQHSPETARLWYWRDQAWFKPLMYTIESVGIFFMWGTAQLGISFWGFKNPPPDGNLQVRGYYKITRHPLYWSVFCLLFGHTLVLGSGLAVLYFLTMELYNVLGVILFENPSLSRQYGAAFDDYKRTVSTIPFLSILRGKVKLTKEDFPPKIFVGAGLFITFIILIHRPVIVFLVYTLPPLGHVTEWFAEKLGS